ncbi:conserved hypothetical protein [Ricinus communis]|uniref:Uncharacterized protein n=1 Tax=Ricinus communis TaxID=3988 RepID=B9SN21_RICCO|nr:conserved hypothetical protein [Ricinus communis]
MEVKALSSFFNQFTTLFELKESSKFFAPIYLQCLTTSHGFCCSLTAITVEIAWAKVIPKLASMCNAIGGIQAAEAIAKTEGTNAIRGNGLLEEEVERE